MEEFQEPQPHILKRTLNLPLDVMGLVELESGEHTDEEPTPDQQEHAAVVGVVHRAFEGYKAYCTTAKLAEATAEGSELRGQRDQEAMQALSDAQHDAEWLDAAQPLPDGGKWLDIVSVAVRQKLAADEAELLAKQSADDTDDTAENDLLATPPDS